MPKGQHPRLPPLLLLLQRLLSQLLSLPLFLLLLEPHLLNLFPALVQLPPSPPPPPPRPLLQHPLLRQGALHLPGMQMHVQPMQPVRPELHVPGMQQARSKLHCSRRGHPQHVALTPSRTQQSYLLAQQLLPPLWLLLPLLRHSW